MGGSGSVLASKHVSNHVGGVGPMVLPLKVCLGGQGLLMLLFTSHI